MSVVTRRASGLLTQDSEGCPVVTGLDFRHGRLTRYGSDWANTHDIPLAAFLTPIAGGSGFSQYAEAKIVDHANGKTSWTMPSHSYLALCTSVPTSTSTGTTIVEAAYTGYARIIVDGNWTAATTATPSVGVNTATITFAACTGSTSTINGFALCDALTVGHMIWWGTVAMTVISTTQTPATVAAGALTTSLS